ncbi:MAG: retroviral-like aspartic protease family protein [Caulobacteraceae bacterium]
MEKVDAAVARRDVDRRAILGLAGAGILVAGSAGAAIVERLTSSRLTPADEQVYEPPVTLAAVADIYRRMTAPIRINGQGPFPFVVDTGANQSVISQELADRLGLAVGPSEPLNGVAGVEVAPTTSATLSIGKRSVSGAVLSILPARPIGGDGMLGLDRLDGQELTLDFHNQDLRIDTPGRRWREPGLVTVKATRRDGQLTLVDADLAGIPVTAFLDSGAQNTIGNMALRALAVSLHPTTPWSSSPILSATGQTIPAEMAMLPALSFGGMKLPDWPVAFADLHTFRIWNLVERPAILMGVDVLSRFQSVCLDFARNEVRFLPPANAW